MPHPRGRGDDDRIGALPDEALQHVLSFLPPPEAVRTCLLARRWRHLWKSIPVLRVTGGEGGRAALNRHGVRRLNRFMSHLLLLRDRAAPLDECEIDLDTFRSQDDPQIDLWVRHALLCKARALSVYLTFANNSYELQDVPLVSRHLRSLELRNVVLRDSVVNFSSCLALEKIWMSGCYIGASRIASDSLKQLTVVDCMFFSSARTRVCLPGLVELELSECWGKTPLLESMPMLGTAFVRLSNCDERCGNEVFGGSCVDSKCENCGADGDDDSRDCVLLEGLSEAKSLDLQSLPFMFIFKRDLMWRPTFSKLKTLVLNDWCVANDLHALICLLQYTPVLEELTLQLCKAPDNWLEMAGNYNPTEHPFASKQIKLVDVTCENFDGRFHKIIMTLSTYGDYIEKINIENRTSVLRSNNSDTDEHKEPMGIPQESGAGSSQSCTRLISHSENVHVRTMINEIVAQKHQILVEQHQILTQQQSFQAQQRQILAQLQRQCQILDQIKNQLLEYSDVIVPNRTPAPLCPAGSGHTKHLDSSDP